MWLYDLQETEWVWCDGNNPDSLCDWATEGCHMPSMMCWMRGKIPVRTSVAAPPCSLIAHWIRVHCVYLLVCECSCSVCVLKVIDGGCISFHRKFGAVMSPWLITHNASHPRKGLYWLADLNVSVCWTEQCRGQIYSARGLDWFCRGLWVFLEQ